jgi:hypothetical protein
MRAMVIGFPKSGTTTIHRACRKSNLHSAHWKTPAGFCGKLIYESYSAGGDPFEKLAEYDVIAQADVCKPPKINYWPQLDFDLLATVRRYHPQCVFILNRRNPQKIVESMGRHGTMRNRIVNAEIAGLAKGVGAEDEELRAWIERHYANCGERFSSDRYYLEVDIASPDAGERLSAILGVDLRWWGIVNDTSTREAKRKASIVEATLDNSTG